MGELKGGYGQDIEKIGCDAIGGADVIETSEEGELTQGRVGMAFQVNNKEKIIPHAPEGCPLVKAKELRQIGDFTACASCTYATLVSDGMIEC
ncbi:MAG: hypothetical protein H6799_02775 [Candidatus Nomurabacteria bacterium]|nr:MAG: hypothetical protein H6799_02775 [Candidatus Nomurabacteria bacterium]HRV75827.1 hypothetical protein [Candidatus Saccharimonadales bacterium]